MITIRQAKTAEWKELQDLNNEVFIDNAQYDDDLVLDWAHSEAGKTYFQELVHDKESICLVAEDANTLVGYIAACPKAIDYRKSRYIEIENMGVIPGYRSQGIGHQLMEKALQWAKEKGYHKAFVNSYFANTAAISFYKKCGFGEIDISLEKSL